MERYYIKRITENLTNSTPRLRGLPGLEFIGARAVVRRRFLLIGTRFRRKIIISTQRVKERFVGG
jgi:hypothetical protein